MKNEWDFFADVQQRLLAGHALVEGFFANQLLFPFDEQRGLVVDEDGNEYELGQDYKLALNKCVQQARTAWGVCFRDRLICFGKAVAQAEYPTDYLVLYQTASATEVAAQ